MPPPGSEATKPVTPAAQQPPPLHPRDGAALLPTVVRREKQTDRYDKLHLETSLPLLSLLVSQWGHAGLIATIAAPLQFVTVELLTFRAAAPPHYRRNVCVCVCETGSEKS